MARLTRPFSVVDGVLWVSASSSSWANELDFYKPEILKRIRESLGKDVIRNIRFSSGFWPKEEKNPEERPKKNLTQAQTSEIQEFCQAIADPNLRDRFQKLLLKAASEKRQ